MVNHHAPGLFRRKLLCLIAGTLGVCLFLQSVVHSQDTLARRRTPVVEAVARVGNTVANLSTEQIRVVRYFDSPFSFRDQFLHRYFDEYFGRYTDKKYSVESPIGSGVIIDEGGYILTNDHVVSNASNLKITLFDKSKYDGTLVSADQANDLAVLKIDSDKPLQAVTLGRGDDLMLGETVIALGNPLGLENTVTTGVISALNREITLRGDQQEITYKDLIQTDAAINPGNSGGPLININGELVGINTAIVDSAQGIGFAIPVSHVRKILTELLNFRKLSKIWIGLQVSDVEGGIKVDSIAPHSPAEKAGAKAGDIIVAVDAVAVGCGLDFTRYMVKKHAGETVKLRIKRGGREITLPTVLEKAPQPSAQGLVLKLFGLKVQDLTPDLVKELGLYVRGGALVFGVEQNSPAAQINLHTNDVIVQVAGQRVQDLDELGVVLDNIRSGEMVDLWVARGRYLMRASMQAR